MGISPDSWHKCCKTWMRVGGEVPPRELDASLPTLRLVPVPYIQSPCVRRQQDVPCLEVGCEKFLLGLWVLYTQNKDYWCCLQRIQQQIALPQDPTAVGVPLGTAPGKQKGGQADSWGGRDFKHEVIKENSEERKKSMPKSAVFPRSSSSRASFLCA